MKRLPSIGGHMRRFPFTLHVGERAFPFELCCRSMFIEGALHVHYFWMDDRLLRVGRGSGLWRMIVDFWWALTSAQDLSREHRVDAEEMRILAEMYPVALPRLAQSVFAHGHLGRTDPGQIDVPEEEIKAVREAGGVGTEEYGKALGLLSDVHPPPAGTQELMDDFMAAGRAALTAGPEGFNMLRKRMQTRLMREQKRRERKDKEIDTKAKDFIRLFSYQAKVALDFCYAQTWSFLLGEIEKECPVSQESLNLLRVWHLPQDRFGKAVLALHPVSAIIFGDVSLRALLSPYLRDPESDKGMRMLTAVVTLAARHYTRLRAGRFRGKGTIQSDPRHLGNLIVEKSDGTWVQKSKPSD